MPLTAPGHRRLRRYLPGLFALGGILVVLLIWSSGQAKEQRKIRRDTDLTAEQVSLRLQAWIADRVAAIRFFAAEHPPYLSSSADYASSAQELIDLFPGFQALNRLDADGVISDVVPLAGNEAALGRNVHDHVPGIGQAVDRAAATAGIAYGPVITLFQGGVGVTSYLPLNDASGRLQGFLNGVFRVDTLVDSCLYEQSLRRNYRFRLLDPSDREMYRHDPDSTASDWRADAARAIHVFDQDWQLELLPTTRYRREMAASADEIAAAVGILLVALLAWLLRLHFAGLDRLAESQQRYRLLVENASDLIVKIDSRGRFLYVSPSYCSLFGRSEQDLLNSDFMPLVHEDDRPTTVAAMEELARPPHTCYVEQRALTREGWRWLSWSDTAVFDAEGRIEAVIGVGRDITARKELEDQLRQAQKLQAVGQLAGGIAHDFNNILQAVMGHVSFARDELPAGHPAVENLETIQRSALRAAELTRRLLIFSRQQVLKRVNVDANRLVEDHLRMLRRILSAQVVLDFEPGAGLGAVSVDSGQIEQVLMNLCVNARDAVNGTGRILITTTVRHLAEARPDNPAASPGDYVAIAVADNGCGMDPGEVARIFDPFFTTKAVGQGTGLGLSTVYGIIRQHGGFIDVVSRRGEGSTFTVHLPVATGEMEIETQPVAAEVRRGSETILVAEDDGHVREFTARALRDNGYDVITAADGEEAVLKAREPNRRIALALLDVVMPGLGGPAAATQIRQLSPDTRVLFASGYAPERYRLPDGPDGHADFLGKPFTRAELLTKVREIIDRR
jgi:PAS domain S-box-containing protein